MAEIIKETVITQGATTTPVVTPVRVEASSLQTIEYVIYFLVGALNVLLLFRLVLKLLGASTTAAFVRMIYGVSNIFVFPFEGIFRRAVTQGLEAASIFEPSTVVAIIVYTLLGWGLVKLARVLSGEQQVE